jgi:geranylgeranyl reductase family protein
MIDVIVAGAGPAGSLAAITLARAGARVLMIDRDAFPREKLCGDTLNPGAVAWLAARGLHGGPLTSARPLRGMRVSGPHADVVARYADAAVALALPRAILDHWLLTEAVAAGVRFESGLIVRAPLIDDRRGRPVVRGVIVSRRGSPASPVRLPASITIAADGRRSAIARALGLIRHPLHPRRWAFGVYAEGIEGTTDVGEMHIRPNFYFGIAPLTGGRCNICLVTTPRPGVRPVEVIRRTIAAEPALAPRFARARFDADVRVMGPLAVDARAAGAEGVLLAGDAAGFVDPMTGDGLHLAMRGAELAAQEAVRVLEHGDFVEAVRRLDEARRETLRPKQQFNRLLRRLTASPSAVRAGDVGARVAPGLIRWAIRYAGDAA